jgi:hypothetical protein
MNLGASGAGTGALLGALPVVGVDDAGDAVFGGAAAPLVGPTPTTLESPAEDDAPFSFEPAPSNAVWPPHAVATTSNVAALNELNFM